MQLYHVVSSGEAELFYIKHSRPEGAICPPSLGWLRYEPGIGFRWLLRCFEDDPRAVYTLPNSPVHKDSCLELFIDFFPQAPARKYLNLEFNSKGTVHCGFGSDRHNRNNISSLGAAQPLVSISTGSEAGRRYWQGEGLIDRYTLNILYGGDCAFHTGDRLRGNFYKCGDETDAPHWGSWSPVERLDFHTPEFFGVLELS